MTGKWFCDKHPQAQLFNRTGGPKDKALSYRCKQCLADQSRIAIDVMMNTLAQAQTPRTFTITYRFGKMFIDPID